MMPLSSMMNGKLSEYSRITRTSRHFRRQLTGKHIPGTLAEAIWMEILIGGWPVDVLDDAVDDPVTQTIKANWLFARLPPWVIDTLSTEQKEAIHQAATDTAGAHPPVNIRVSIPLFRRRYFFTVVGGEENRSSERRARERHRYPLRTVANIFFFLGLIGLFYVVAIMGLAMHSTIVEF
jgi:hypothetical protein